MDHLLQFGWTDELHRKWEVLRRKGLHPARVTADFGTSLKVAMPGIHTAELTGKLAHYANKDNVPKVGDWVTVRLSSDGHVVIEGIIPRESEINRKVAGKRMIKQVVAANVDIAFVLLSLDGDFSSKRLERFLYQLSVSNVQPVIVLNKADKTKDITFYTDQLKAFALPVIIATATTGYGVDEILQHIPTGKTAILLGSSGVGKSTLTNKLLGREVQETQTVRTSDSTGRHTTVHRELFILPNGGLLIDTPGIRELQLWGTQDVLDEDFDDVASLARQCKYTTCRHGIEPGCAIQEALRTGMLDPSHYASYLKMKGELTGLKEKTDVRLRLSNRKSHKHTANQTKAIQKEIREETS
jgi:ribosome biogenesis GTPase